MSQLEYIDSFFEMTIEAPPQPAIFNPAQAVQNQTGRHVLAEYRNSWDELAPATEFVLNGILAESLNVLGASAGAGKTTLLVKLACHVIKAFPDHAVAGGYEEGILKQPYPRHVVYLSEHPEQVEQITQAMSKARGVNMDIVKERLHVVRTKRLNVGEVVRAASYFRDELSEQVTMNDRTQQIKPWVIVDTLSATIDLENESDNSEVGRAIAKFKEEFADIPVTIVAHIAKAIKFGESKTMSVRGASAFGADANQETFVTIDEKTGGRFFEYGSSFIKHRFKANGEAFKIVYNFEEVETIDRWGRVNKEEIGFVDLVPITTQERAEMAEQAKIEAANQLREHVLETIKLLGSKHGAVTKKVVTESVKASTRGVNDAINYLIQTDNSIDMIKAKDDPELYQQLTNKPLKGGANNADIIIIN